MEQTKLDKTNLERIAKNPPAQRQDFKTDLSGVYLRAGPRSMAVRVTRQIDGRQSWGSIKLNPNALPSLPVLKRKIAEIQTGRIEDKPTQYLISKLSAAFFESQTSLAAGTVDNYQRSFDHVAEVHGKALPKTFKEIQQAILGVRVKYGEGAGNNAVRHLRRLINFSRTVDKTIPEWPTEDAKTAKLKVKERRKSHKLTFEEQKAICDADLPGHWNRVVRIGLLTGLRPGEIAKVTCNNGRLFVGDTKNGSDHILPATETLRELIQDGFAFADFKPLNKYVKRETGIHFYPKRLRNTFAMMCDMSGVSSHNISLLLNHESGFANVTAGYIEKNDEQLLDALQKVEATYRQIGVSL